MIHNIPPELFDQHYFSFDVTSLFTNVPLNETLKHYTGGNL